MQVYQRLCCKKPAEPKAEYSLVCIGLTKAGKTTLLSVLCNENTDNITATTGTVACTVINISLALLLIIIIGFRLDDCDERKHFAILQHYNIQYMII